MQMKKLLFTILTMLLLSTPALAAEGVRVAVIDTGISTLAVAPDRIAGGKNYIRPQDDLQDKLGHGTAVAAILVGSEAARIEGICPTATLVPMIYASLDENGKQVQGDTGTAAQAIYDAIDIYGCRIINISSGSVNGSSRLQQAVAYAEKKGVLVVSCAGNSQKTRPGTVYYPGGYESVICVGAANSDGTIAPFSQQNETVDLLALGTDLRLASVKGTRIRGEGTSFAAAIVTGAAARIWTERPELTADEVRNIVLKSARTVEGWQVFDLETALAHAQKQKSPSFSDVSERDWFYDGVNWAVERGVTAGTSATTFSPMRTCTYAEILTFLWNAQGKPEHTISNPYRRTDVQEGRYYYTPLLWAWEMGVVTDPALDPGAYCSRSDVVTFLWRLSGCPKAGAPAFSDVFYSDPFAPAVSWAVEQGITSGTGNGMFSPEMTCTRGQIVVFLRKFFVGQTG